MWLSLPAVIRMASITWSFATMPWRLRHAAPPPPAITNTAAATGSQRGKVNPRRRHAPVVTGAATGAAASVPTRAATRRAKSVDGSFRSRACDNSFSNQSINGLPRRATRATAALPYANSPAARPPALLQVSHAAPRGATAALLCSHSPAARPPALLQVSHAAPLQLLPQQRQRAL